MNGWVSPILYLPNIGNTPISLTFGIHMNFRVFRTVTVPIAHRWGRDNYAIPTGGLLGLDVREQPLQEGSNTEGFPLHLHEETLPEMNLFFY